MAELIQQQKARNKKAPLEEISEEYFNMLFTRAISIMAGPSNALKKGQRYKRSFFDDLVDRGLIIKEYRELTFGKSKIADVKKFREEIFKLIMGIHSDLPSRTRSGMIQLFSVAYNCYLQDERLKREKEKKENGKEISKDTDSK